MSNSKKSALQKSEAGKSVPEDYQNVISKLKAGRILTARECELGNNYALEMSGGERYLSGKEIGKLLGVTRQAGDEKVQAGCLVRSFDELLTWEFERREQKTGGKTLNAVRQKKLEIETKRLEFLFAIDRGEYISATTIEEGGLAAGAALAAEINAISNDLPGQLVGLDERQIRVRLMARMNEVLTNFRSRMNELEHGGKKRD